MPYSTIKTFLTIGATVAALGATIPLANAQATYSTSSCGWADVSPQGLSWKKDVVYQCSSVTGNDGGSAGPRGLLIVKWAHPLFQSQIEECRAREESVLENAKGVFDDCVQEMTYRPLTSAQYKAQTGRAYGPRAEERGTPLCNLRWTRDGCQR